MRLISALAVVLCLAVSAQAQYVVPQQSCQNGQCYKNTPPAGASLYQQHYGYPQNYYQPYYVVPKQKVATLTFEVYKTEDGQWGWELKLETKVVSRSVEVYKTKNDAAQVAQDLFGNARTIVVQERAGAIGKAAAEAGQKAVDSARIKNGLKNLGVEFPEK